MPSKYHITVDSSVVPVHHGQRKMPIAWILSISYPEKVNGSICMSLNPKDWTEAIIHKHHKTPTMEEVTHSLSDSLTSFSKHDVHNGFWLVLLDHESALLTILSTHFGHYQFLRMPFSLQMSQDMYQMCMDQIIEFCLRVMAYMTI